LKIEITVYQTIGFNLCVYIGSSIIKTEFMPGTNIETATFGTGCFWCTEAFFQQLEGVIKVTSGYRGGM
jgi:peptide-methionine (S)-S-oxide reductase